MSVIITTIVVAKNWFHLIFDVLANKKFAATKKQIFAATPNTILVMASRTTHKTQPNIAP
jgi:hypothetical protein